MLLGHSPLPAAPGLVPARSGLPSQRLQRSIAAMRTPASLELDSVPTQAVLLPVFGITRAPLTQGLTLEIFGATPEVSSQLPVSRARPVRDGSRLISTPLSR